MAKFNKAASQSQGSTVTENHEGYKSYKLSPELELYSAACTSLLSNKYYEDAGDFMDRLRGLIGACNPEFVAKLAVYAREEMYLRSMPLVLTVELAKIHKGDNLVGRLTERVVQRVDEITEILAYYQCANPQNNGGAKKLGKLSKQIQKGLGRAFNKFNEYQFAKYDRATEIKLKDALLRFFDPAL